MSDRQTSVETADINEVSVRGILDILYRRRQVILLVLVLFLLASIAPVMRPRQYTASGSIRVQPGASSMYRTSPLSTLGDESDKIASETAIAQSRTLYLQVAKQLNLLNDPAFLGKGVQKQQTLEDPMTRETVVRRMRGSIKVNHNTKDEIINITCTTVSPQLSAKIVNTLINDYIAYLFQMRYGSTKRVSVWLLGQLDDLKEQIEQDQTEIIKLQQKLGVVGFNEQTADYLQIQKLDSMTRATSEATMQRILAEAKMRHLQESDPNLIEGEANALNAGPGNNSSQVGLLQNLRNSRSQVASNYARLLAKFGSRYPEVREQKAQLDELEKEVTTEQARILNQAKLTYNVASANEKMDKDVLGRSTDDAFKSGGDMVRYVLLLHDYQSHRALYEELVQRLREAGITAGLDAGEIDIVDLADLPSIPNPPGPKIILSGALIIGIIFGCFFALAADAVDIRVKDVEQAKRTLNLPLLAMAPHVGSGKHKGSDSYNSSAVLAMPGSQYTEAIQSLRTSILLATPGQAPKIILITSAAPAEGKSTIARNTSIIFARHGARVLLVDCDLRKGTQSVLLGLTSMKGVSSVLTGQTSLEEAIEAVPEFENLFILSSGPLPPDPAVLIASEQMAKLVKECADKFDFVILDSPPVLGLSDSINLGQLADAAILVAREGMSSRKAMRESLSRLNSGRLPVIGFVLNDVDVRAHAYSYGYGYGYGSYEGYYRRKPEDEQ